MKGNQTASIQEWSIGKEISPRAGKGVIRIDEKKVYLGFAKKSVELISRGWRVGRPIDQVKILVGALEGAKTMTILNPEINGHHGMNAGHGLRQYEGGSPGLRAKLDDCPGGPRGGVLDKGKQLTAVLARTSREAVDGEVKVITWLTASLTATDQGMTMGSPGDEGELVDDALRGRAESGAPYLQRDFHRVALVNGIRLLTDDGRCRRASLPPVACARPPTPTRGEADAWGPSKRCSRGTMVSGQ